MDPLEEAAALSTLMTLIRATNPTLADLYQRRIINLIDTYTRMLYTDEKRRFPNANLNLTRVDPITPQALLPLPEHLSVCPAKGRNHTKSATPEFESVEHLAIQVDGVICGAVTKAVFTLHEIELTLTDGSSKKSQDFKFSVSPSK